jgi:AAA+ ATPase superfamily predicted ATPase
MAHKDFMHQEIEQQKRDWKVELTWLNLIFSSLRSWIWWHEKKTYEFVALPCLDNQDINFGIMTKPHLVGEKNNII